MNREEFFEWLDSCPTHKWEVTGEEHEFVTVSFRVQEEENEMIEENGIANAEENENAIL